MGLVSEGGGRLKRFFWIGAIFIFLALSIFLVGKNFIYRRKLLTCQKSEMVLTKKMEELRELLKEKEVLLASRPRLDSWEIEKLKKKGLRDPASEIIGDLRKHKELIPFKAVLGGMMYYSDVYILSPRWVIASFEDGHIMGRMLLRYSVSNKGKIFWKVIDSYLE